MIVEAVLDASAVLALIKEEPGADRVADAAPRSMISTVNVSEAVAKLVEKGAAPDAAKGIVFSLPMQMADFDAWQAALAGMMWMRGKRAGLSFGDRACLALAESLGVPVLTADKQWKLFDSTIEIRFIR